MDRLCDLASERAVLSGIAQYGDDGFGDVQDILQVDTFTNSINQAVYKAFVYLFNEQKLNHIDQASLLSAFNHLNLSSIIDTKDSQLHIRSIFNGRILLENLRKWAAQIRKLQIARMLCNQLDFANAELQSIRGSEPIEQILGIAENAIFDFTSLLNSTERREPQLLGVGIHEYLDNIEANPCELIGISSGMAHYDKAIGGGFRRKTVSLIGARQKVGKSMLAANIGLHVSKNLNIPVLYLDTEMAKQDHWSRALPNLAYDFGARVTINELETGKYAANSFSRSKIRQAADEIVKVPFHYMNVSGVPFEEVIALMRRWVNKTVGLDADGRRNDCLIIYDYLKMVSGDSLAAMQEYQVLGLMATTLHNFTVTHDIPILTFTQLNKDGIDRESTDVISGSDRILWLVTNFSIYKTKTDEEIANAGPQYGTRKLIPISSRHGEGMEFGDYINVHFEGKFGRIKEGETRNNLKAGVVAAQSKDSLIPIEMDDNDVFSGSDTETN